MTSEEGILLPIAACAAWAPGLESLRAWTAWAEGKAMPCGDGIPPVPFVDALMRRRLSRFARMALHVANECVVEKPVDRVVFASRHGELQRTVGMLHALGRSEEVSPTDFSLSVHNAVAGVHSIVTKNRAPSVAVAAGEESFACGVLEAAMQWHREKDRSVLFIYADEPVPTEYRGFVAGDEYPHALALLLAEKGERVRLHRAPGPNRGRTAPEMQSLAFLRAWFQPRSSGAWSGAGANWYWSIGADVR